MVRPRPATWLWPLLSLLLIPLALRRHRRLPAASGVVATLLAVATMVVAAERLPTQRIEVEDGHVRAPGCDLHPAPWTIARPRFRSGWVVVGRCTITAPVVGEGTVRLSLATRLIENDAEVSFTLDVMHGDTLVEQVPITDRQWRDLELGPYDWPRNAPLVLRGRSGRGATGKRNGVVIDRVDFHWGEHPDAGGDG